LFVILAQPEFLSFAFAFALASEIGPGFSPDNQAQS
jgi:hypothetical protein